MKILVRERFAIRRWSEYWVVHVPAPCGYPREVVHKDTFEDAIAEMDFILAAYCRPALGILR